MERSECSRIIASGARLRQRRADGRALRTAGIAYHGTVHKAVPFLEPGMPLPEARQAGPGGLVAVGGDLRPETLLDAYAKGIFPWYESGPILWFSPDPRMILRPEELRVGRSLRRVLRKRRFEVRLDTAFERVIRACARARRPGQRGTWLNDDMIRAYLRLHELGYAHSAESYRGATLAGALYGVALGAVFFGESMFTREDDASKFAFVRLVQQIHGWGFRMVDCQVYTRHMSRFGAREWPRAAFLTALREALRAPTRRGRWELESA